MSEIPDWLMQLTPNDDEDIDNETPDPAPAQPEDELPDWLMQVTAAEEDKKADHDALNFTPPPEPEAAPITEAVDPMEALRTQMAPSAEASFMEMAEPTARTAAPDLTLGLLSWQRFFLSVLLFLDVAIIGLLFLVMLGSIAIPMP